MVLSIFWVALPSAAYRKGRSVSDDKIDTYLKEGCVVKENEIWGNCYSLKSRNNEIIYTGILVAHTNDFVAFFTEHGSFVRKFPNGAVIVNELANENHNKGR